MSVYSITFMGRENAEGMPDTADTIDRQIISRVCDLLRLLEHLRAAKTAKLLESVKIYEPNPPSFVFRSYNHSDLQMNASSRKAPPALPAVAQGEGMFPAPNCPSFPDPPPDTINPALLKLPEDGDAMILDNAAWLNYGYSMTSHQDQLGSGAENTPSFVSSPDDAHLLRETAGGGQPSTPADCFPEDNSQKVNGTDLIMGLPTPPSEPPSEPPANHFPEPAMASKKPGHRPKSQRLVAGQIKSSRLSIGQDRSLRKRQGKKQQAVSTAKEYRVLVRLSLGLHGLLVPGLQQALEVGEGLIRQDLSEYQDSCVWQQDFWSEDAIKLPTLMNCSALEKFCHVFRYVNMLVARSSNQELRLRISRTLLYLTYETLTQKWRSDMHSGNFENPEQHRASTLTTDHLLRCMHPQTWDSMDAVAKKTLRRKLQDEKRQGSRWWRAASVLRLGCLVVCGDVLSKVINNHKISLPKLDFIIKYAANAHPSAVSLYREFDAMVKQILLGETPTAQLSRQMINDRACQTLEPKLTPQEIDKNWVEYDPATLSQELIRSVFGQYV
ncbi:hypothetical protein D8B26_007047 [Coccidioides posadasii str. Silveira]|uniref:Predicted protein n=1 Tax=Coccidioides posadasii (strain RMSCC 757 / Silveira) TaxID=443226 RepID=E9DH03_COCPS|nr:predicted protein [Coccidioides posadasii str. Silveira]QVM12418.1 hypothetical protein D8B26_007047 [Coccidioides posadasii str. Silveira]